jgi:L-fuconolactonase
MIIDAHQHFWNYDAEKHSWIDDSMQIIQRDFTPADLQILYTKNNVDGCVTVQVEQTEE